MITFRRICIIFLLSLTSCIWGPVIEEHITGKYYLVAADIVKDSFLGYQTSEGSCTQVIPETIFAAGFNYKYIIAKQHPYNDKKITNYFTVPINNDLVYWIYTGVLGPLSFQQFNEKRKELKIGDDVKFTVVIEDLE
jgi:hypothetical protein